MILSVYISIAIHWSTLFSFIYKANTESKRDVVSCRSGQVRAGEVGSTTVVVVVMVVMVVMVW